MQLRHYLRMLQHGWWIIVLCGLAALLLALVAAYVATPLYTASARFIVSPKAVFSNDRDVISSLDTLDKRSVVATYAEVLNSRQMYVTASEAARLSPEQQGQYTITTAVLPEANILDLSVTGPDPEVAALLANILGQQTIAYVTGLYQIYEINFLDQAMPPDQPFTPQPMRDSSLALVLGLMVGALLAIVREHIQIPLEALRRRSLVDPISNAYTQRHFQRLLEGTMAGKRGTPLALGLVQLDGLQDLLDSLPTPVAQRLLRKITSILHKELRGHDSVARWDEITFAVLLPSTSAAAAMRTMERIKRALEEPLEFQEGEFVHLEPTVSVSAHTGEESGEAMVWRAKSALGPGSAHHDLSL